MPESKQAEQQKQQREMADTVNDLTFRLGQKDLALGRAESVINRLASALQAKDDEIKNLKIDLDKLEKKAKKKDKKSAGPVKK